MATKRIRTVIKGGKVEMDLSGFEGKKCIEERKKAGYLLQLFGVDTEVESREDKERVEEHVYQKSRESTSQ